MYFREPVDTNEVAVLNSTPLKPGEIGKIFLDFESNHEEFDGGLWERAVYKDLQDVASEDEIKRLLCQAVELKIIRRLPRGLLLWGPGLDLVREFKEAKGQMPEERLREISEYTFDLKRQSQRWRKDFVQRCVNFRKERLREIESRVTFTQLPFAPPPLIALHIIPGYPLRKDDERAYSYFSSLNPESPPVLPMSLINARVETWFAGEEYQIYTYNAHDTTAFSYLSFFRDGSMEAVIAGFSMQGKPSLHIGYEREVIAVLPKLLSVQETMGAGEPVGVTLTLTGVEGCQIVDNGQVVPGGGTITKDRFQPPVVQIQVANAADQTELARLMKGAFDAVWHAARY